MKYFYWFLLYVFMQTAVVVGVDHVPEEPISSDDFMKSLCDSLQKTPTSLYKASFVWAEDFQLPLQHYACPESQLLDVMVEKQKEKIFHKIGVLKNKKMNITLDCFFSCEIYSDCVYVGYYLELEPASLFDIYVNIKIYFSDQKYARILSLCADYPRSSGVGRYLINKVLAFAFCVGKNVIELNASPYATKFLKLPQLVHFYETAGFSSKKLHFLGKNPLFMEMVLHAEKNNEGVYQICFKKHDVKEELYAMQKYKCCTDVLIVHPDLKPQLSLLVKSNGLPGRLSLNLLRLYQKNNVK